MARAKVKNPTAAVAAAVREASACAGNGLCVLEYVGHMRADSWLIFEHACKLCREGIVASCPRSSTRLIDRARSRFTIDGRHLFGHRTKRLSRPRHLNSANSLNVMAI